MKGLLYSNTGVGVDERTGILDFERKKELGGHSEPESHRWTWNVLGTTLTCFYILFNNSNSCSLRSPPLCQRLHMVLYWCYLKVLVRQPCPHSAQWSQSWGRVPEVTWRMVLRWWFPRSSTFLYLLSQPFHVSFLPSFLPEPVAVSWERWDTQRAEWRWTATHYPSRSRYHLLKRLSSLQQCKTLFIQALSPGSLCLSLILVGAAHLLPCSAPF